MRLGGSREEAASIQLKNDRSWEHTLIGSRNRWLEDMPVPDHWKAFETRGDFRTQVYEGEDVCIDGSKRHTAVLYECGEEGIQEFHVGMVGGVENRSMACATTKWSSLRHMYVQRRRWKKRASAWRRRLR